MLVLSEAQPFVLDRPNKVHKLRGRFDAIANDTKLMLLISTHFPVQKSFSKVLVSPGSIGPQVRCMRYHVWVFFLFFLILFNVYIQPFGYDRSITNGLLTSRTI